MDQVRLGIIGAGSIVARKHLLALAEVPEIAIAGLCRRDAAALGALADRFRIARRCTDWQDLVADPGVDAVLVATGPAAQPGIVRGAAAAGKHVFAEKPMAATAAEARALADVLHASPAHFQLGFNKRFYYGYRAVRRAILDGELGTPIALQARFWFQPGRADPLLHNGLHFLDLARFFMGPVEEVFARRAAPGAGVADAWSVSLRFADGGVGNLLISSLASWDYVNEHLDLVGSNHSVVSVENGRVVSMFRRGDANRAQLRQNTLSGHWWSGNEEQGFTGQFRAFARAILDGRRADRDDADAVEAAGAEDGVRALELLEAVRESAATQRPIALTAGDRRSGAALAPPGCGDGQRRVP
jgi:predicted dehydrogenase